MNPPARTPRARTSVVAGLDQTLRAEDYVALRMIYVIAFTGLGATFMVFGTLIGLPILDPIVGIVIAIAIVGKPRRSGAFRLPGHRLHLIVRWE